MNKAKIFFSLSIISFFVLKAGWSRDIDPIVSTDWLSQHLDDPKVAVLDIRSADQYKKGHIPGAISAPLSAWAVESNGLNVELPSDEALADLIGKLGMSDSTSKSAVIVNRVETDFSRADATRVAWTCMVAGIKNVAILSGGYTRWTKENRAKSTDPTNPQAVIYRGVPNRSSVASKSYVLSRIGKATVVDARVPEDYFGITSKPGHIKSAVNLPTPWIFTVDGSFKPEGDLREMVAGVIGMNASKEIIVYCGVGGYASSWWFLLTQAFGFTNVKIYDGSMEEWTKDPNAPASSYSWH